MNMNLRPRDLAFQQAVDSFASHVPEFKKQYGEKFGESVDFPDTDFGLLEYGSPLKSDKSEQCLFLGASLVEIYMVEMTKGQKDIDYKYVQSDFNNFNFLRIFVHLFTEDGKPFVVDGDLNDVYKCDKNDYSVAFGRECSPFAVQMEQLSDDGWLTAEELANATKHELSDQDCINLLELYSRQSSRLLLEEDISLKISSYPIVDY